MKPRALFAGTSTLTSSRHRSAQRRLQVDHVSGEDQAASLHWAEAADLTLSSTQKNDRHMFATRTLVQPFTLSADAEADVWWAAQ
eukprot:s2590_g5.t1